MLNMFKNNMSTVPHPKCNYKKNENKGDKRSS